MVNRMMTIKSWTIAGKRSVWLPDFQGLAISATTALMMARTIVSRAMADRTVTSPTPWRTAASSSAKPTISQSENSSRPRT